MVQRYSKFERRQIGNLPKVTPVNQRVNNNEAQAWGQVARTGGALFNQFAQYARDDARTKAIDDAEGVVFEKDSTGLTIMPPPMQEGGSIYQENYKRTIGNIYKREVKTDIEGSMSRLYAKHFLEPDVMSQAMEDSLSSIVSNVAPQNQQEMARIGRDRINIFMQRAVEKATTKAFNTNINGLRAEKDDITNKLINDQLDDLERENYVSRMVEIDLDLADNGLLSPFEQKLGERNRIDFENYFMLRDLSESRSQSGSAILINDPSKLIGMAQLLEGNEGGADNIGVTLSDGLKDYNFTRKSIQELIQNPDTRIKIAAQFRARAKDITDKNTQSERDISVQSIKDNWADNKLTPINVPNSHVQQALDEELEDIVATVADEFGDEITYGNFISSIGALNENKHIKYVDGIRQYIDRRETIPDSLITGLNNITLAPASELANFYFPFYKQMQSTEKLKEIWRKTGLSIYTNAMFKRMERLVETSSDPSKNKESFENVTNLLKASNNEQYINKLKSMLSMDDSIDGVNIESPTLIMNFLDQFYGQQISTVPYSEYNQEMKALAYRETLEYISKGSEQTIEELTEGLIDLSKRVVKARANPQEISGGFKKEDFEKMLYNNDNDISNLDNTINSKYNDIATNSIAFGGDTKHAILNVKVAEAINNKLGNKEAIISVFEDEAMYRTAKELFQPTVFSNINQNQKLQARGGEFNRKIIEPAFKNKEEQQAYRNNLIDNTGNLSVKKSMYAPFTVNYKGVDIPMIFGKTYKLHYDETTEKTHVVLIDDDGEFRTINGYLEIDNGSGSEPFVLNTQSIIEENTAQLDAIAKVKQLDNIIEKEKDFIEKEKELTTDSSANFSISKSQPVPTINLGKKIFRHFFPKNTEERIAVSQSLINEAEEEKQKIIDEVKETDENLTRIEEIKNNPEKQKILKYKGTGTDLTMNVASIVAKMLPANNEENLKNYLIEIANVESDAGTNPDTYVGKNKDMGIWQNYKALTTMQLYIKENTKGDQFASNVKTIEDAMQNYIPYFSIANTTIEHLKSPLVSAVVARLYIALTQDPIPDTMDGRSVYWKQNYNTEAGQGTIEDYRNKNK
mgnify:CR=1 FL=1